MALGSEPQEAIQHEDAALKTAFRYFSDVLLPYFGISKKAVELAATKLVHLDVKNKNPMTQFTEGVNTFKIVPVIMRGYDADQLIAELKRKQECKEELTKEDMALLTICLLMEGKMPLKDRVKAAYQITKEAVSAGQEELDKVETVLYVMADKFLESAEMDELMEVIGITRLGQKLVNRGIEQGMEQGIEQGIEREKLEIAQKLIGLLDDQTIAERTELPLKTVLELKEKKESVSML